MEFQNSKLFKVTIGTIPTDMHWPQDTLVKSFYKKYFQWILTNILFIPRPNLRFFLSCQYLCWGLLDVAYFLSSLLNPYNIAWPHLLSTMTTDIYSNVLPPEVSQYCTLIPQNEDSIHRYILPRPTVFPQYVTILINTKTGR